MTKVSYEHVSIRESNEPLVDLSLYDFVLEPAYFKQGLAPLSTIFLRKTVAEKLQAVQRKMKGLKFKIWDGYRPRSVQSEIYNKFWNCLHQKHPAWSSEKLRNEASTFVTIATDPTRIPPHATGGTVDLTLVDVGGKNLAMGTEFDHFGPESASLYFDNATSNEIASNRRLLREAMISVNFRWDAEEWWHYDYGNQLWAVHYKEPFAFYGEMEVPGIKSTSGVD